jgi:hypothetical protein
LEETLAHAGAINGWNANVAFTPTKQIGVVTLCSCDSIFYLILEK